jgi:hypothetical protein
MVRLRSRIAEWCKPVLFADPGASLLIVTGDNNPTTEGAMFVAYSLVKVAAEDMVFVPKHGAPTFDSLLSSILFEELLRPIPSIPFASDTELSDFVRNDLAQKPFVCHEDDQWVFCKGIFLHDLEVALKRK